VGSLTESLAGRGSFVLVVSPVGSLAGTGESGPVLVLSPASSGDLTLDSE
jgi:hypothetical protein